jgi:DNA primase
MALPPGFLDELRTRLTLSDVVGRKVTWDRRKSNAGRGDHWAPCPFHQEKTASFHVDDRKGFYYCFGCQAKGDMITFVKEIENLSFIEAVERLAAEAGMEMPKERADPQAAERRDRLTRLIDVMEQAVAIYGLAFRSGAGQGARSYAERRGLAPETLRRFGIGYAPDSRRHQTDLFRERGVLEDAIAAGLVILPDDGGTPYDRFRDRLMFPIRDARGRCIAFGGRALSPNAQAKYLNSPETDLFHKGRTLYNIQHAREAAGKTGTLIVAEGYMDVVALVAAGFEEAVAPLGTAITEDQLALLWRIAPEPVVALDGDKAGLRAADRLVDLALPRLTPGHSLRFCLMPDGNDPDDLIRSGGVAAMRGALDDAIPLIEMLWRREVAQQPLDTPERRAAFDGRLRAAVGQIADQTVRAHYAADLWERRQALFRSAPAHGRPAPSGRPFASPPFGARSAQRGGWRTQRIEGSTEDTRATQLVRSARPEAVRIAEALILLVSLHNPQALGPLEAAIEDLPIQTPEFEPVLAGLLSALADEVDPVIRLSDFGIDAVALLSRVPQARTHPQARPGCEPDLVRAVLSEAIARHRAQLGLTVEFGGAGRDLAETEGDEWTWRKRQVTDECHDVNRDVLRNSGEERDDGPSPIAKMLESGATLRKKR